MNRLTNKVHWEDRWLLNLETDLTFNPEHLSFRDIHNICKRFLTNTNRKKFLEIGAYPGKYLWYFHNYFGYEPWGIEFVESFSIHTQNLLDDLKIPGHMITDDFFNLKVEHYLEGNGWDLVASFGFVEHFIDSTEAVSKHIEVACPGGLILIYVPNHAGWNGTILRLIDREVWKQHNCMSLDDLLITFSKVGYNEIIFSGYIGNIGFWNTGLNPMLRKKLGSLYPIGRAPFWIIEQLGQWIIPKNQYTSPAFFVLAQKQK